MDVEQASSYEVLPVEDRRRGQYCAIVNATAFNLTSVIATGSVFTLFLLALGAEAYTVGISVMLMQISPIGQLGGLRVMPLLGKVRTLTAGLLIAVVANALLVLIALFCVPGPAAVWLAIACIGFHSLAFHFGLTGWMPLLQDVSSGDAMGAFFSRMRTTYQSAGAAAALLVGAYLGKEPVPARFALTLALGAVITLIGIWYVRQMPERPVTNRATNLFGRLRLCYAVPEIRKFLAYGCLLHFFAFMTVPFWIVLLKNRGLPDGFIVVLITTLAIGNVTGVRLWGRLVDSFDYRPVITIALLMQFLMGASWLGIPLEGWTLYVWAMIFYLAWGFADSGSLMGYTRALFNAVPASYQVDSFTLITLCRSACGALGGFAGGKIFQHLLSDTSPFGDPYYFVAFMHVGFLVIWLFARRLSGYDEQPSATHVLTGAAAKKRALSS